jgi:hypothetical protein
VSNDKSGDMTINDLMLENEKNRPVNGSYPKWLGSQTGIVAFTKAGHSIYTLQSK